MATLDPALLAAVKATKKEAHAELSHKRQLRRNTARKRANLAIGAQRAQSQQELVNARAAGAKSVVEAREGARSNRIAQTRSTQRRDKAIGTGVSAVQSAGKAATLSGNSNLFLVTVMMIVMLALFYNIVTKAEAFSGFLGGLGDLLHKVSSTAPLFKASTKLTK